MSKSYNDYCQSAVDSLNAKYHMSKAVKHNASVGAIREQLIKDFLKEHLPELVHVISGQIVDSHDNHSRQQDIVLIHKSMPRLQFASDIDLIFIEGVISAIEIKTNIDKNILNAVGQNFKSVRDLSPNIISHSMININHNWPSTKILCCLITYSGIKQKNYASIISELPADEKPDLLLDLSKGLLVINNGTILPIDKGFGSYIEVKGAAKGLANFLIFLTEITGALISRSVNWRAYC